jgi:hypothetical protein
MKSAIGWIAALGGGYLLLKYFGVLDGTSSIGSGTSTSVQAATTTSVASNTMVQNMATYLAANNINPNQYATVDFWNAVVYVPVKKVAGPAPEDLFPGVDRNTTYTFGQYAAGLVSKGLSGLGVIAHYVNPYWNPAGIPMGSYLTANGAEKFIWEKGR